MGLLLGDGLNSQLGAALVIAAAAGSIVAALRARTATPLSRQLLDGAGLTSDMDEPASLRDRVLRAAGFDVSEPVPRAAPSPFTLGLTLLGFAVAGAGWGAVRMQIRDLGPLEGRYAGFSGTASSDLREYDWGWGLDVHIRSISLDSSDRPVDLRAWVSGDGEVPRAEAGERIEGQGRLEGVGEAGFDDYLVSRGVDAKVQASETTAGREGLSLAMAAANGARGALREGLVRSLNPRQAGLLLGLAIGDTSRLDPEVEEDFRASGLGHLLAVSGSNVAIFLAPLLALAGALGARLRTRAGAGVAAVVFFALLTRWEPSVLRAAVMAGLALVAFAAGRRRSSGPALGAAVLLLLVADPRLAGSVGFELSVAATAGIAALASPIAKRLGGLPKPLALAVAATLAAQAAVTPLLLLRFEVVPTVTLLANVLAFPAVAPALLLGVVAAALGLLAPAAGAGVGHVAGVPLDYLIGIADRAARFPLPSVTAQGPALPVALAMLVILAAWRLRRGRRPVGALVAIAIVTAAAWSVPLHGEERTLTATFLDVGQGDAALVRSPGGATMLIDAGPDEQAVAADLARMGVARIDLAVATHSHADHVGGFPAVLARFPVSLLLDPGCPGDSPVYARFLRAVEDEEISVEHPRGGDSYTVGDISVRVLGPDECSPTGEPNNESIVLLVSTGDDSILFSGDAEVPAQEDMLADNDPVEADVLKVPHHGGDTSVPAFLEAIGSTVAVVSSGPNTYGHPNPSLLHVLDSQGMSVYRTDLAGEVTVGFTVSGEVVVGSANV